jgi:hypothetical protein
MADGAIVGLLRFVGCWLAFTICLMAAANELPATVNKVCPTGNRPLRTAGMAAARVGIRVDIIEPHGGDELDSTEDILPALSGSTVTTLSLARTDLARVDADASASPSERGLPHRAAPVAAGTDDSRPSQRLSLTPAPPGARVFAAHSASYFPPHYNRPPPSVSC